MADKVVATGSVKLAAAGSDLSSTITKELNRVQGPLGDLARVGQQASARLSGPSGFGGVGLALAGVTLAATGFAVAAASKFQSVGMEVFKLQRVTGGTAEEMSKLRFIGQQFGLSSDQLTKSLGFLSKAIAGNNPLLSQYGIATKDVHGNSLSLNAVLLNTAAVVSKMPDGWEKNNLVLKLFGKSGKDLIGVLDAGRDGLVKLGNEATKYGLVLTDKNIVAVRAATAAHREQTAAMQGLQVQIGANVLPVMTTLTKEVTQLAVGVMPALSAIINTAVIPALKTVGVVAGAVSSVLSEHSGAARILGGVLGSVLIPALILYTAVQVKALAVKLSVAFLESASAAVRMAASMGLMTGSMEAGTVALTGAGVAAAGFAAIAAVVVIQYMKMQDAAKQAAGEVTKSAKSPTEALKLQQDALAKYHAEMKGGLTVLGAHIFATDKQAKAAATAAANYKATKAEIDRLTKSTADNADTSTAAAGAIDAALTKQGATMQDLGGRTKLTTDEIDQLAASMNIDLSTATPGATEKLAAMAVRLSYTSESALKLADAQKVLGDWTQDVAKRSTALASALDSVVVSTLTAARDADTYKNALQAVTDKSVAGAAAIVTAQRAVLDTQRAATDAVRARADAEQHLQDILHPSARNQTDAALAVTSANNSLERSHIDVAAKTDALAVLQKSGTATALQLETATLDLSDAKVAEVHATESLADAQKAVNDLTPQGIAQSRAYQDAQRAVADANQKVSDTQAAARDAVTAAAKAEADHADRQQELAAVTLSVVDATIKQTEATFALTGSWDAAKATLAGHVADLRRVLTAAGMTSGQVDVLIAKYHLLPSDINTIVTADTSPAMRALAQLQVTLGQVANSGSFISSRVAGMFMNPTGTMPGHASGTISTQEHIARISEGNKPEVVLPITDKARSKQLIDQAGIGDLFGGPVRGGGTVVHNHYTTSVTVDVAGSVISEGQLLTKVRQSLDEYNVRAGRR